MAAAYYSEWDPYAADWLRNLIAAGHLPPGDVDERSIVDVRPDDLRGYTQCHFFAGIGGWAYAARLAGWPDDEPLWTGSCPCQPFSVAGKGLGAADERHLWPAWFRLIAHRRPSTVFGEQVSAAIGKGWLDGVSADLEDCGYAIGSAVLPACAVDAPHRRDRLWFVAESDGARRKPRLRDGAAAGHGNTPAAAGDAELVADTSRGGIRIESGRLGGADGPRQGEHCDDQQGDVGHPHTPRPSIGDGERGDARPQQPTAIGAGGRGAWDGAEWLTGADGKARRVKPGIRLLAHGVPARVAKLRAFGNAIVPQLAAEFIAAYREARLFI
jgi:DNA (cytosine-5)-methyltransferase 1